MRCAKKEGTNKELGCRIVAGMDLNPKQIKEILRVMALESDTDEELRQKIVRRFGDDISITIKLASEQTRCSNAIFLHRKLGGLTLRNTLTWVIILIDGLAEKGVLEF